MDDKFIKRYKGEIFVILTSIIFAMCTVFIFLLMKSLYSKFPWPIFIPALTSTSVILLLLLGTHTTYETFMLGGQWLQYFLGPAVVALAFPMYKQFNLLIKQWKSIISSGILGIIFGMSSGLFITKYMGYSKEVIVSILPKSITTPVAMNISQGLGGNESLTSVFVMIAGFTGVVLGPIVLKIFNITNNTSRGISLGISSHALGTSKASEFGIEAVSASTVTLTLSAIGGSLIAPIISWLFL